MVKEIEESAIGSIPLDLLRCEDIQRYLMSVPRSRQREHLYVLLKDSLSKAVIKKKLQENPMNGVTIPRHIKKPGIAFTREHEKCFVEAAKGTKWGFLFLIMLFAGLRKGEAMALLDTDITNDFIVVNKTVSVGRSLSPPKTLAGVRRVPILSDLVEVCAALSGKTGKRLCEINVGNVQVHFEKILRSAGLAMNDYTVHSLRHTFATRCIENGVPVKVLQKWLGHSDYKITMNIYVHVNSDFELETVEKLNCKQTVK